MPAPLSLFDFTPEASIAEWRIQDDVVMGGRSNGDFTLSEEGHGVFHGTVSLENNGGFSSVRYRPTPIDISAYRTVQLRIKGDGKRYQLRFKSNPGDRHSYIYYFETTGDWQIIELPLENFYPTFRGRQLDLPNYPGKSVSEVAFLIGNKRAESFRLEIDGIWLIND